MAAPWEKYAAPPEDAGPWQKYATAPDGEIQPSDDASGGYPLAQQLKRTAGLTARYATEGASQVVTIPANALSSLVGLATGTRSVNYDQQLSDLLTQIGLPKPESAGERIAGDAAKAVASAGGVIGAAKAAPGAVSQALQALPGRQAIAAAGGAGSAGAVREQGGGPLEQFAAGLVGGVGAPLAVDAGQSLIRGTAKGAWNVLSTLTKPGQEKAAGRVLRDASIDPMRARNNLSATGEIVKGSTPTSGAASKDIGLLALEKGLRGQAPARFGSRLSEQNLARQSILDEISGSKADISAAQQSRNAITAPMREQALASQAKAPTEFVTQHIDDVLASPVGKRDVVSTALKWARGKLDGVDDAASLYEIRKDIGDAMSGRLGGEEAKLRLARKELMQLRSVLDDSIEAAAPGFKAYLSRYQELSKPINQMEVLQELRRRSTLAAPDVSTGREFISQAKFRGAINLAAQKGKLETLTADQLKALNAVAADLDIGAAHMNSAVRAPGSDTFQNLSMANAIGAATGGKSQVPQWMKPVMRPFAWLLKGSDERINELLIDAMLDPKLASQMMERATPKNARILSAGILKRANAITRGGLHGASTAPQERREGTASRSETGLGEASTSQ